MLRAVHNSLWHASASQFKFQPVVRNLSVSSKLLMKKIIQKQEGNTLVFEGVTTKSEREDRMLKVDNKHSACALCAAGIDVKHTDVLIVRQFLSPEGELLPRNITGLCQWQHRRLKYIVEMIDRSGLLRSPNPENKSLKGWRKFNQYFDESLIKPSWIMRKKHWESQFEEAYQIAKAEKEAHEAKLGLR